MTSVFLDYVELNIACGFNSSVVILLRHASTPCASSHRVPRKAESQPRLFFWQHSTWINQFVKRSIRIMTEIKGVKSMKCTAEKVEATGRFVQKTKKQLTVQIWECLQLCCLTIRYIYSEMLLCLLTFQMKTNNNNTFSKKILLCLVGWPSLFQYNPNTVELRKLYLEQPLRVVLHGHLQLLQPLRRLVLVLWSILLKGIV